RHARLLCGNECQRWSRDLRPSAHRAQGAASSAASSCWSSVPPVPSGDMMQKLRDILTPHPDDIDIYQKATHLPGG
ncbi:MAG TPA: hypothetical protein VK601_03620, partial [Kofleriaceae bacterium]|nr:hypothetical protein [Kofleriaceae bacterium]